MNDSEFETGLKEFTDPAGVHHEAFKSNFAYKPELKEKFDALFKNRWPEEPVPPPGHGLPGTNPAPQPESAPKPPEGNWPAPPATDEKSSRDDYAIAEQHLQHEWGKDYE